MVLLVHERMHYPSVLIGRFANPSDKCVDMYPFKIVSLTTVLQLCDEYVHRTIVLISDIRMR